MLPSRIQREGSLASTVKFEQLLFLGGKLINWNSRLWTAHRSIQKLQYDLNQRRLDREKPPSFSMAVCWQKRLGGLAEEEACRLPNSHFARGLSCSNREGRSSEFDLLRAVWKVAKLQPEVRKAQYQYELALAAFQNILARSVRKDIPEGDFALPETLTLSWRKLWSNEVAASALSAEAFGYWHEIKQIRYNAETRELPQPNVMVQGDYSIF